MELWIVLGAAVVVVGVVLAIVARRGGRPAGPGARVAAPGAPPVQVIEGRAVVTLEISPPDPQSPAVRRLVHDTAGRAFADMPEAQEVEVRAASGEVLGVVPRQAAIRPESELPGHLYEPRTRRSVGPDLSRHLGEDDRAPEPAEARAERPAGPEPVEPGERITERGESRAVAERFDLSPAVRERLRSPDDAVDLVRAILEAGGMEPSVEGDLIRVGDLSVVVVRAPGGGAIGREALNRAYLVHQKAGARRKLVVAVGYLDMREVRRRQALDPKVTYIGSAGVQRMADAVELGLDPIEFATAPSPGSS